MISSSFGSIIFTMNSTIGRGVKNWPISPLKVLPRNFSKAIPFTSVDVAERLYLSSFSMIALIVFTLRLILSSLAKILSFPKSVFVF